MNDYAIVWSTEDPGPCVLCGGATTTGAVGWHQADPPGPVCEECLLDGERILGELLRLNRAVDNGPVN